MDEVYMKLALELAQSAAGQTSPNPPVGAVVVKDGEIIGMGAHMKAGGPHAEVHALHMAGERAKGATIYVTLEPCSHHGKTPPCADLVIESGIKRAVIAVTDANKQVAGTGIKKLQAAGIEVVVGIMQAEAEKVNAAFFHYVRTKRPYVTLKSAASLDGKTATYTGDSKWITGEAARLDVHYDRHRHDAILVGVNTVIQDDPSLTTRLPDGNGKNALRIILDTQLHTPLDAKIINDGAAPTWIFVGSEAEAARIALFEQKDNVQIIQMEAPQIEIGAILNKLGAAGIMTLYVEGGAAVHASFLEARMVNEAIFYIAPKLIGGRLAPTVFSGTGFANIADTMELTIQACEQIGKDLKIVAVPIADEL